MHISILTLFPQMFTGPFDVSIIKRSRTRGILNLHLINIREYATDRRKTVDDRPYGGGAGMILRVDVLDRAILAASEDTDSGQAKLESMRTVLLDPKGVPFTQQKAREYAKLSHLILICGRYEGFDERVRRLVREEISIGDYILTGGELPAMVVVDAVMRLLPGTFSRSEATKHESFSVETGLLEYPQYTRPLLYRGMGVPSILRSGNHKDITVWRNKQSMARTKTYRPHLLIPQDKTSGKTDRS